MADLSQICNVSHDAVRIWYKRGWLPEFDVDKGRQHRRWLGATLNLLTGPLADKYLRA